MLERLRMRLAVWLLSGTGYVVFSRAELARGTPPPEPEDDDEDVEWTGRP